MSGAGFWLIQGPGWLLFVYFAIAQCVPAFNYDWGVRMGTQEPAAQATEVGVAFWKGFAVGDLIYTPLLGLGLVGHLLGAAWSPVILGAALGITVYWPVVCLWTVRSARGAPGWSLPKEGQYWIVLPLIALWAVASLFVLVAA